jgi:hypothetical protein
MEGFDHILNWTLKYGSHPFPGKDGGTCINEAALVAAGFEYRPIRGPADMPKCFSRPLCNLAMWLNDFATDRDRQRLLPYVTRLACADSPKIERAREAYINSRTRFHMTFDDGLEILEGALAIGRPAEPFAAEEVKVRMDAVRRGATTPTVLLDSPQFAKIKRRLGLSQAAERVS